MKPSTRSEYKDAQRWRNFTRIATDDPRSPLELTRLALAASDEDARWEYIHVLQQRGTTEVLEAAQELCHNADPEQRALGADILGQNTVKDKTMHEAAVNTLLELIAQEDNPTVLYSAAVALGHQHDPRAIASLIGLKDHPDQEVRYGVVHGLLGYEDHRAIAALIVLSADHATQVRNWATFGLGSLIETNTPAIREALYARMADADEEVRGEAFVGLARCGDPRLVAPLLDELEAASEEIGNLFIEAAIEAGARLRDPRLYPALTRLEAYISDYQADDLEEAMKLCWNQKP